MTFHPSNIATTSDKFSPAVWWALALLILALCMVLGWLELSGEEPRRAVVAWEMMMSGDYIVPQAYGLEYYNKPPMYHWILAGFMSIFGSSEFVVRLPGILSFLGVGALIYGFTKNNWGKDHAVLPTMIFLFSGDLLFYAAVFSGEIDLFFTLTVTCQAIGVYQIGRRPDTASGYWLAYLGLLASILTKGWSALHFHCLTLVAWTWYQHNVRAIINRKHLWAILVLVSGLALYYYAFSLNGNLTHLLLNNFIESSSKVATTSFTSVLNQVTETPMALIKISLPWTLLLIFLIHQEVRSSFKGNSVLMYSLIFILSNIWIYWIFIDIRDRYLYPFIPFLCIVLAGIMIQRNWWSCRRRQIFVVLFVMIGLRLIYNIAIIPRLADDRLPNPYVYRDLVDSILTRTDGHPIDLLTPSVPYDLPFEYDGITQIEKQPIIPYQIPYYLIRKTNHSPRMSKKIVTGKYYFVLENQSDLIRQHDSLFRFEEPWYHKKIVLIQAK
jgi:4-amino-4-deoxy-L-arabinose transferase-like glycosyltransferase